MLILTYLLSAFTSSRWISVVQLGVFVVTAFLALRSSRLPPPQAHVVAALELAGSAAAAGLAIARPSHGAVAAASIWTGLLLLATVVLIVRRILSFTTVTVQSIYAAVSAYLILGLMFAAFYVADAKLHGGHFFAQHQPADSQTVQYFSFTTLTTLGYGDLTAVGSGGRAVAVVEALSGQIFLATLVARLVAAFRGPGGPPAVRRQSRRPPVPPPTGSRPVRSSPLGPRATRSWPLRSSPVRSSPPGSRPVRFRPVRFRPLGSRAVRSSQLRSLPPRASRSSEPTRPVGRTRHRRQQD